MVRWIDGNNRRAEAVVQRVVVEGQGIELQELADHGADGARELVGAEVQRLQRRQAADGRPRNQARELVGAERQRLDGGHARDRRRNATDEVVAVKDPASESA